MRFAGLALHDPVPDAEAIDFRERDGGAAFKLARRVEGEWRVAIETIERELADLGVCPDLLADLGALVRGKARASQRC